MRRNGIEDPDLRKATFAMAMRLVKMHHPEMTQEELDAKRPDVEEIVEYIFVKFQESHRESINGVLEIMDQMGSFPALRARLVKYRDEM